MAAESLKILETSINEALDRTDTELYDWDFLRGFEQNTWLLRCSMRWQNACCIGPIIHRLLFGHVRKVYDIFQNFMVCSNHALKLLEQLRSLDEVNVSQVLHEAKTNLEEVREILLNLRAGYPGIMKHVDLQHCQYYVLRQFTKYYHHLAQSGQMDAKHEHLVQEELDLKIARLKLDKNAKPLKVEQLMQQS